MTSIAAQPGCRRLRSRSSPLGRKLAEDIGAAMDLACGPLGGRNLNSLTVNLRARRRWHQRASRTSSSLNGYDDGGRRASLLLRPLLSACRYRVGLTLAASAQPRGRARRESAWPQCVRRERSGGGGNQEGGVPDLEETRAIGGSSRPLRNTMSRPSISSSVVTRSPIRASTILGMMKVAISTSGNADQRAPELRQDLAGVAVDQSLLAADHLRPQTRRSGWRRRSRRCRARRTRRADRRTLSPS